LQWRRGIESLSKQGPPPSGASAVKPDENGFLWIDRGDLIDEPAGQITPIRATDGLGTAVGLDRSFFLQNLLSYDLQTRKYRNTRYIHCKYSILTENRLFG
jgi:hypothetical protein